jgi:23S rRNA (guanosine2251-2'-O)-methyltransferase
MAFKNSKSKRQVGSGGKRRKRLEGKGPTPKAKDRVAHVNYKANKGFKKSKPKSN